jgi:hypothetical protein
MQLLIVLVHAGHASLHSTSPAIEKACFELKYSAPLMTQALALSCQNGETVRMVFKRLCHFGKQPK